MPTPNAPYAINPDVSAAQAARLQPPVLSPVYETAVSLTDVRLEDEVENLPMGGTFLDGPLLGKPWHL